MKTLIILIHLIFLLSLSSIAQIGPGGIGTTDGSSSLKMWYQTSNGVNLSGSTVTSIDNSAGITELNMTDTVGVRTKPTLLASAINGYDAFHFGGSNSIRTANNSLTSGNFVGKQASSFIVCKVNDTLPKATVYSTSPLSDNRFTAVITWNTHNFVFFDLGDDNAARGRVGYTSPTSITSSYSYWSYGASLAGKKIYKNGSEVGSESGNDEFTEYNSHTFSIGGETFREGFKGDITEIIIYTTRLNSAQRIIVENYLSTKYAIAADNNGKYNSNYDKKVIGIGTESDGSQTESNDGVGLTITQNSGFDNGDYLMAGNWTETNTSNTTDIGGVIGLEARWQRIWYFDITDAGTAMTADITFDFSDASSGQNPGDVTNYKLIYRSNITGDWSDDASSTIPTINGDQIKFSDVNLSNDGYYTIGTIDETDSSLPITLIEFEAEKQDNHINIDWKTATEINNDFFNIERSNDASNWESIIQIKGAGNSNEILSYNYLDNNPIDGISYYRLKQTDFDGKFEYSNIRKVQQSQKSNLSIYPNPTQNSITIDGYTNNLIDIQIYNSLGKELSSRISYSRISDNSVKMNLSDLPKGVYFIRIDNEMIKVFKN